MKTVRDVSQVCLILFQKLQYRVLGGDTNTHMWVKNLSFPSFITRVSQLLIEIGAFYAYLTEIRPFFAFEFPPLNHKMAVSVEPSPVFMFLEVCGVLWDSVVLLKCICLTVIGPEV